MSPLPIGTRRNWRFGATCLAWSLRSATCLTAIGVETSARAVAEHYGLAEGYEDPLTRGDGELLPDDPARTAEEDAVRAGIDPVHDRVALRESLSSGEGANDKGNSPGITGGDRFRDAPPRR